MIKLNAVGELFIQTLGIPREQMTQKLVFDILSLQKSIIPYSSLESREIYWKIHRKMAQGGHINIAKFKEKFSPLEK